jgi:hypothetical protein
MVPVAIVTFKKDAMKYRHFYDEIDVPRRIKAQYEKKNIDADSRMKPYINKYRLRQVQPMQAKAVASVADDQQSPIQPNLLQNMQPRETVPRTLSILQSISSLSISTILMPNWRDPRLQKLQAEGQKKNDGFQPEPIVPAVDPEPEPQSYLDEDEPYDDDILDDDSYLHIDERLRKFGAAVTIEQIEREFKRHYPTSSVKGDDQVPKWRIMYDRTGRLNCKFRACKSMCINISDVRTILKFKDQEKTRVDLKNITNKLLIEYQTKKTKKNTSTTICRPFKKAKTLTPKPEPIVEPKKEYSPPIKRSPSVQIKNRTFIQQLQDQMNDTEENKTTMDKIDELLKIAVEKQTIKSEKQDFNSESTSLERHLMKKNQRLNDEPPKKPPSASSTATAPLRVTLPLACRPTSSSSDFQMDRQKIKLDPHQSIVTNTTTNNNASNKKKKSFWDSSSSDDDHTSGENKKKLLDNKYCERIYIKLNNLNKSPKFKQLLAYSKQYYEQNIHSLNTELLKLESRLFGVNPQYKHYFRNNRNEDLKFDVDGLKNFKIVDETNIFSCGVVNYVHVKRSPHFQNCATSNAYIMNSGPQKSVSMAAGLAKTMGHHDLVNKRNDVTSSVSSPLISSANRNPSHVDSMPQAATNDLGSGITVSKTKLDDQMQHSLNGFTSAVSTESVLSQTPSAADATLTNSFTSTRSASLPTFTLMDEMIKNTLPNAKMEAPDEVYDFSFGQQDLSSDHHDMYYFHVDSRNTTQKNKKNAKKRPKWSNSNTSDSDSSDSESEKGIQKIRKKDKKLKKTKKKEKKIFLPSLSSSSSSPSSSSTASSPLSTTSLSSTLSSPISLSLDRSPSFKKKSKRLKTQTKQSAKSNTSSIDGAYDDFYSEYDFSGLIALESDKINNVEKVESSVKESNSLKAGTNLKPTGSDHPAGSKTYQQTHSNLIPSNANTKRDTCAYNGMPSGQTPVKIPLLPNPQFNKSADSNTSE